MLDLKLLKITDFLNQETYSDKHYWHCIKPIVRRIEHDDSVTDVDDTIEEKPYTDANTIVGWRTLITRATLMSKASIFCISSIIVRLGTGRMTLYPWLTRSSRKLRPTWTKKPVKRNLKALSQKMPFGYPQSGKIPLCDLEFLVLLCREPEIYETPPAQRRRLRLEIESKCGALGRSKTGRSVCDPVCSRYGLLDFTFGLSHRRRFSRHIGQTSFYKPGRQFRKTISDQHRHGA